MAEASEARLISIVKRVPVERRPDGAVVEVGPWVESVEGGLRGEDAEREWERMNAEYEERS